MAVRRQYRSSSYSAVLSIFIIILFNYKTRILTSTLQETCENVEETERSLSSYDCKGLYWFLSQDKGIRRHLGAGGLNGFFLQHDRKSLHAFCISLILLSGDMCAYNPGPLRNPCGKCKKGVGSNQKCICCDVCNTWFHVKAECVKMSRERHNEYSANEELMWKCFKCLTLETVTTTSDDEGSAYDELITNISMKGLKVGHLNVNGLVGKISEIRYLLRETKFDILGITESHLDKDVMNDDIFVDGYKIARSDRNNGKKGGGCAIYFSEDLNAYEKVELNGKDDIESVWIDITIDSQKLLLGRIYRPQDNISFYDNLHKLIESL